MQILIKTFSKSRKTKISKKFKFIQVLNELFFKKKVKLVIEFGEVNVLKMK